jgi:hypothetical protein
LEKWIIEDRQVERARGRNETGGIDHAILDIARSPKWRKVVELAFDLLDR